MGDTLAFRSDEGRGYQRNASGSWKQAMIRRSPNEETLITTSTSSEVNQRKVTLHVVFNSNVDIAGDL